MVTDATQEKGGNGPLHGSGMIPDRILVIDDEILIQMLVQDFLEEMGFQVDLAGSGAEAIERLNMLEGQVAAAIVDLGLPDMKGDTLVDLLRRSHPALPMLIASGQDRVAMQQKFAGLTGLGFLGKPYLLTELQSALAEIGVKPRPVP